MKYRLRIFGKLALIWLLFFELARSVFFLYQFNLTNDLSGYEILMPLLLGLRMDLAMTAYWLIIPCLALTASFFVPDRITKTIISGSFYSLAIFTCLIVTTDFELYHHWNFRMDTTALFYAGAEGVGSISIWVAVRLILIFCVLIMMLHLTFQKWVRPKLFFSEGNSKDVLLMLMVTALLFIPIRSSFSVAPLNTGVVYFHKSKSFPNHAGINVVWNFLKSIVSDNSVKYPADFLDAETTLTTFSKLMDSSGEVDSVLTLNRPNIVLIILESFTSKVVEPLGGQPNTTPNLNQLCNEGILFESFFASGDRTDKGIISILSAYPSQPKTSIIKFPNKTQTLPCLPKVLSNNGYHTSFVYGGDVGFANMESYLNIAGFSQITEDDDFDLSLNTSKWGVHDEFIFDRLSKELDSAEAPFFKVMLSLSSHEPFDVPFGNIKSKDEENLFLNSCTYTDSCLGNFIRQSKMKEWWKNTLIIITADHGHRLPFQSEASDQEKFAIPMLWLGGVIRNNLRIKKTGGQTDIAPTLLSQLGIDGRDFSFGKNLLSSQSHSFAVYSFRNGFGYVSPEGVSVYDFDYKRYLKRDSSNNENSLNNGKAFMQTLFTDYNKR